ncbi:MAG: Tex-like N-terminal domain-containing protein, partial [Candidatus Heimdallarchaeota archaeon]
MTQEAIIEQISIELSFNISNVSNTVQLLADGNTVPFISRYRKEITGNLSEIDVRDINYWFNSLTTLYEHKDQIIRLIKEQDKLTPALREAISKCKSVAQVEDIYAPFKKKRKTKSDIAKENGLEPLSELILEFDQTDPEKLASDYVNNKVTDSFEAFKGAVEIIAEKIGHDLETKGLVKDSFTSSEINIKISDDVDKNDPKVLVYKDYFDYNESVTTLAPHRLLAINREEKEKILKLKIDIHDKEQVISQIKEKFKPENATTSPLEKYYNRAIDLAYSKFLAPSNKAEIWRNQKVLAFKDAINVFSKNLESLLLTPPVSGYTILGIDPGFRTGCKTAIISPLGKVIYTGVLYLTSQSKENDSLKELESLLDEYNITLMSIGDGTASRETEEIVSNSQKRKSLNIPYLIVTEAGASVYSASEVASTEFPELDVSLRGTISIARRVQDPLAEYVKIDPWSIGVGQYQHDLPQNELKLALMQTVESVVNRVGVELNSASPQLLSYVSGVSTSQAKAIYSY